MGDRVLPEMWGDVDSPVFSALEKEDKKKRMPKVQTQPDRFLGAIPENFLE